MEMYRLLTSLADYHGETINYASVSGIISRIKKPLSTMFIFFEGSYIVRLLPPLIYNTTKRLKESAQDLF